MKELDVVSLRSGRAGVAVGSHGTIVHENVDGKIFIVEFSDANGRTVALEDLAREELELISEFKP
ncbi:DUF4926 domain-containing protein [uncultured Ruegeria sp.]|uniref:DUF4926 domain-containing protein n=1 Tax=uncultured Ruegeria sp. TaxID=259304 RepID=UPI003451DCBA